MEKHLDLSLFSVGISAWLMIALMLMIMPSSSADGFGIRVNCYLKLNGHAKSVIVDVEVQKLQTVEYQAYEEPEELEDDKKLADYGIVKDSEVIMLVDYPLMMTNSSTNGFKIKVTTDKKIFTRFIFHKTNTIPVRITGSLTVKQLKKLIIAEGLDTESKDHIKSDVHRLTFQHGTTDKVVLNNNKAINEYNGIREGAEISLSIDEFQVYVLYTKEKKEVKEGGKKEKKGNEEEGEEKKKEKKEEGKKEKKEKEVKEETKLTIWVNGTDTVKMLKQKIENATQIEPTRQTFQFLFNVLDDSKTLDNYRIEKHSLKKEVKEEKKEKEEKGEKKEEKGEIKLTIWVNGTDTVQMLKQKIKNVTQIEPTRQSLSYRKPTDRMPRKHSECAIFWLENEKMLNAYGIWKDAIVYMEQIEKGKKNGKE
ncbi:hypothetical protein niasHS_009901 [Heterodera schachtii]|uniref:Ubiquitin-like domain-containing protein n=1 Tax=Heterodera schachtii TaxID=97005 RepID=A0ABD2JCZ1_HETSC